MSSPHAFVSPRKPGSRFSVVQLLSATPIPQSPRSSSTNITSKNSSSNSDVNTTPHHWRKFSADPESPDLPVSPPSSRGKGPSPFSSPSRFQRGSAGEEERKKPNPFTTGEQQEQVNPFQIPPKQRHNPFQAEEQSKMANPFQQRPVDPFQQARKLPQQQHQTSPFSVQATPSSTNQPFPQPNSSPFPNHMHPQQPPPYTREPKDFEMVNYPPLYDRSWTQQSEQLPCAPAELVDVFQQLIGVVFSAVDVRGTDTMWNMVHALLLRVKWMQERECELEERVRALGQEKEAWGETEKQLRIEIQLLEKSKIRNGRGLSYF